MIMEVAPQTEPETETPDYHRRRRTLVRHLHGDGIEIGALHDPLDLSGAHVTRIRYVDRFDVPGLREQYPTLDTLSLVPVDIVDDGEVLGTIPDSSLDFVIANHMIEHTRDPIGSLRHWLAKLRPGGVVYFAMPDKRVGWDANRPVTTLAHLLEDYRSDPAERIQRDRAHFAEWHDLINMEFVDSDDDSSPYPAEARALPSEEQRLAEINHLIEIDYSIHFHVFTHHSFLALLGYLKDALHFPFVVVEAAPPLADSWESIFILRRTDASIPAANAPVDQSPPALTADQVMPPAEAESVALARKTLHLIGMETRVWKANTRAWQAEQKAANAEQRASAAESALQQAQERLRWLESEVIPAKNADILAKSKEITAYAAAARRIEALPPVRIARRVRSVAAKRLGRGKRRT
jgi:SAM-dependent methyltransferase